jgi:hypothetical protein
MPASEARVDTMQDHYNTSSTAEARGASTQDDPSRYGLPRCECCDAAIPPARQFSLEAHATAISCIVCGHQNESYARGDGLLKTIFASPSGPARKEEI